MELLSYIRVLKHRKREILITALITVLVAVIGRALVPVKYSSSAVLRVIPYSSDNPSFTQLAYATRIMKTYVEIGSSSVIMTNLREELGLTPAQPATVEINIIPDTELLQISVTDSDPVLASDVANSLAGQLINDNSIRDIRVTLIEPASISKPPSTVSVIAFYALAVLVGLLGGLGLAFLFENIDPRLYDEKQVENISGLQTLGYVPSISGSQRKKLVAQIFPFNHAFQRLCISLEGITRKKKPYIIMITSSEPHEGKSSVAANLAYCLARSGCKTLLIDADMYQPALHHYFGLPNELGSRNILFTNVSLENAIQETEFSELSVIANGTLPEHMEELLLNGEQMKKLLAQLAGQYDYVILDTPAFLGLVDSMTLSPLVDGVLLVTRLGETRQDSLISTVRQLDKMQAKILGLVVNQTSQVHSADHYHLNNSAYSLFLKIKGRFRRN